MARTCNRPRACEEISQRAKFRSDVARRPRTAVVDGSHGFDHRPRVVTKTISIDSEAYERLSSARLSRDESFSEVIKRGAWSSAARTAADLLAALPGLPLATEATLALLESRQCEDQPPVSAWR